MLHLSGDLIRKFMLILFTLVLVAIGVSFTCVRNSGHEQPRDNRQKYSTSDQNEVVNLSYEAKEHLISIAHKAVNDFFEKNDEPREWPEKFDGVNKKVFVGFRVDGKKKGSWSARKNNLAETVYVAALRTAQDRRYSGAIKKEDIPDLKIEIFVLGELMLLDDGYEPGIHGIRIEKGNKAATFYNSVAIERNYKAKKLWQRLCKKAGLPKTAYDDPSVKRYYFNTVHFATTRFSDKVITFNRCNTAEFKPDINRNKILNSLTLAVEWLVNNVNDRGIFNYQYHPSNGKYSRKNNMIRQLMASRLLAELSRDNADLCALHRDNLEYILAHWYKEKGQYGYIYYNSKSKLGANAMALRTLAHSPFFDEYRDKAEKLAACIISMQNADGSLEAWFIRPDYKTDDHSLLYYYGGQAILSLVELYQRTGDRTCLEAAVKAEDYYLIEYVDKITQNYYPALVPWHTMALSKLYKTTKDKKYLNAIFVLNDKLIKMQNQNGKPFGDYLGRFYDPAHREYGIPFSASTAIYVEGLAYAYEMARLMSDVERQQKYKTAIVLGVHNLINLQFNGANMYYLQRPERVKGAIRYRVNDNRIRIDTTQHAIDAFCKILDVFGKQELSSNG